ncbi:hypothetical protein BS78_02G171900 [Paspalum vaginatum]|nr:hypothetical protein BS78_02G171900 [Paspalum vaginatum]
MSSRAAEMLGLPPGVTFHPDDAELVELFLLPRAREERDRFPHTIIDDDSATSTPPWELLERHGLGDDVEVYFFVRGSDAANEGSRKAAVRSCGGGTWVSQRRLSFKHQCVGGETIEWSRHNLNLHMGRGKRGGGSTGWVMHEYTATDPPCPFLRICHIVFSGHGQKRKRTPDDCRAAGEPAPRITHVETSTPTRLPPPPPPPTDSDSSSSTCVYGSSMAPAVKQDHSGGAAHASSAGYQQEPSPPVSLDEAISERVHKHLDVGTDMMPDATEPPATYMDEQVLATDQGIHQDTDEEEIWFSIEDFLGSPYPESSDADQLLYMEQVPTTNATIEQHQPTMVQ